MIGCLLSCFREQMLERIRQITNFIFTQGETRELVKLFGVLVLNRSATAKVSAFDLKIFSGLTVPSRMLSIPQPSALLLSVSP